MHIQKPSIFRILEYSEPFCNCIPTHIQNPIIFTKIDKSCIPWKFRTLTYWQSWNIQNSDLCKTWKASQKFKMECFPKIVKSYMYFSKPLYIISLTGFWILPSLKRYLLTFKDDLALCIIWEIFRTLPVIVNSVRHIHVLFRHIVRYLEPCVTLTYSEPYHISNLRYIQNSVKAYSGIFRTLCNALILRSPRYSQFWHILDSMHIQNSVYLVIFKHIQWYLK